MMLLHVSDFHYRRPWFDWLRSRAVDYDAVCFTGDLLDLGLGPKVEIHDQACWARIWLNAWPATTPLFVCSGNHDWWLDDGDDAAAEGRWLSKARRRGVAVDGDTKIADGRRFVCTPWLSSPEVKGSEPVVLLTHAPPGACSISKKQGGGDFGDTDVACFARQLEQGSIVLSGHVHHPAGWFARLGPAIGFNPGADFGAAIPNHVSIDTRRQRAEFHGSGRRHRIWNFG